MRIINFTFHSLLIIVYLYYGYGFDQFVSQFIKIPYHACNHISYILNRIKLCAFLVVMRTQVNISRQWLCCCCCPWRQLLLPRVRNAQWPHNKIMVYQMFSKNLCSGWGIKAWNSLLFLFSSFISLWGVLLISPN